MRSEITIRKNGSKRVQMHCDEPSRTKQEFKDECDLGKLMKRFGRTQQGLNALAMSKDFVEGQYFDVSSFPDLQTARNAINRGKEVFEALPAILRTRFDNSPDRFLDFVSDPKNLDELRVLGLAKPKVETPVKAADAAVSTPPVKG